VTGLSGVFANEVGSLVKARTQGSSSIKAPELADVPVAGESLDELRKDMGVSSHSVRKWLNERFDTGLAALGPLSGKLFVGAIGTLTSFGIMLVVLFFTLRDGPQMVSAVAELIPWPEDLKIALSTELVELLHALVFGTVVTAMLQGILVGAAFAVLDLRAPVVFGALAALLAMLPVGGTALVWGPAAIVLVMQDRWIAASALALWGALLVGTMDNLLQPYLVAHRVRIGTMTIFVGVIGGLAAFGLLGIILGPMILVFAKALLRLVREPASTRSPAPASPQAQHDSVAH
jgi:predicted PurR-regulated permease PerM